MQTHFIGQEKILERIREINDYLFRFSFQILKKFVGDPIMIMLFYHMIMVEAGSPDRSTDTVRSLARHQAALKMIKHSCFKDQVARAYEPSDVLEIF